ncbi:carboxyl transferase domain-containing protein, partial [Bacillus sp. SIMBA_069]
GAANIIFAKEINESTDPEAFRQEKINEYRERFANPYVASANGIVDDVIDPRDTRKSIASALEMLKNKKKALPKKRHGNIPL